MVKLIKKLQLLQNVPRDLDEVEEHETLKGVVRGAQSFTVDKTKKVSG